MSRSGYNDECDDNWALIRWRGVVASAIRGKRGQAFLRELIEALDAMPVKRLISHDLIRDGEVCAIGSVGVKRGVDLAALDTEDYDSIAAAFGVSSALVREIEWLNDEDGAYRESPEYRWVRLRDWAAKQLFAEKSAD